MLKNTVIAASAAVAIGLGALGATTSTASAAPIGSGHISGPGFSLSWGSPGYPHYGHGPRRVVCQPKYERVRVWVRHQGWVWKRVHAGQECRTVWQGRRW